MRAAVIHSYGGPEELKWEEFPDPVPADGEVLLKTIATSINPVDLRMRSGGEKTRVSLSFPAILGLDIAGTVEQVGAGVESPAIGDTVFAHALHTYASACVVPAADLAMIPRGMEPAAAAALPTVTTTGAQLAALALDGSSGKTVLVTGAVGNVGRSAVFAAKELGGTVIAAVLARQTADAQEIGADRVVALDRESEISALDPVDSVADTLGGETAALLLKKLRHGGIYASVAGPPVNVGLAADVVIRVMRVKSNPMTLVHMAEAVQSGKLSIPLGNRFTLRNASQAHAAAESGAKGKIVLVA
jgi:NADPH:quinone reductase-like Zn-dependent oxidoreductase